MRIFKIESREIRSFRMRERILSLKSFFENGNRAACFIMSDSVQPSDRSELRDLLRGQSLTLSFLSKKIVNLLMQNPDWSSMRNLLKGNVVKVEPAIQDPLLSSNFTKEHFQFLIEHNLLSIRVLFSNQKLYRQTKVQEYLKKIREGVNFKEEIIINNLTFPITKGVLFSNIFCGISSTTHHLIQK